MLARKTVELATVLTGPNTLKLLKIAGFNVDNAQKYAQGLGQLNDNVASHVSELRGGPKPSSSNVVKPKGP